MSFGAGSQSSGLSFSEIRNSTFGQDSDDEENVSSLPSSYELSSRPLSPAELMSNQAFPENQYQMPTAAGSQPNMSSAGAVPQAPIEQVYAAQSLPSQPTTNVQAAPGHSANEATWQQRPLPATSPTIPAVIVSALASLPQPYTREAPRTFKGSYAKVEGWLTQYEKMVKRYQIKDGRDRCDGLLDYCSLKVKRTIRSLSSFRSGNWETFKQDVLNLYDAARARQQFQPSDIQALARKQVNRSIDNLSKWLKYRRRFQEKGGELVPSGKMTEQQLATYFWLGIPEALRKMLELHLCAKFPQRDNTKPYNIADVCEAAEHYFNRSHFVSTVPDAEAFGTLPREEDSGDDTDTEEDSESDMEELDLWRKLFRGKVKERSKGKDHTDSSPPVLPHTTESVSRERARTTQFSGSQAEVADLITRLNRMQLDNPEYGALYYRAITIDPNSRSCISRAPVMAVPAASVPVPLPATRDQRPLVPVTQDGNTVRMVPFERRPPNGPRFTCNGCSSPNHKMYECPGISEKQRRGELKWDGVQRKLVTPDGRVIERRPGENLLQALDRLLSEEKTAPSGTKSQSMMVTIPEAVHRYYDQLAANAYMKHQADDQPSDDERFQEVESSEDEWEEEEWEEQDSSEDELAEGEEGNDESDSATSLATVLNADRSVPRGKDARIRSSAGPRESYQEARSQRKIIPPLKADGTRPTHKDSLRPVRRAPTTRSLAPRTTTRSPPPRTLPGDIFDPIPPTPANPVAPRTSDPAVPSVRKPMTDAPSIEISPRLNGTDIAVNPQPYDAREPTRRAASLPPEHLRRTQPRELKSKQMVRFADPETPQSMAASRDKEEKAKGEKTERKSELARRADKQSILERILSTPVQVSVGEVLGTSRELSSALHDMSKVRLSQEKVTPQKISRVNTVVSPGTGRTMLTRNAQLIEFFLEYNGRKVRAILDTGSQINVINSRVYEDVIRLPIDLREHMTMNDANGGVGHLEGALDDLGLWCGSIETRGFYFVGDPALPFQILLGRPWINDNMVSIDERRNGTYLVFKDSETWEPNYEMMASVRPGKGPQYRLTNEQRSRQTRSFHIGLTQEEEVSDSEPHRQENPENATDTLESAQPSSSRKMDIEENFDEEIAERQRSWDTTRSPSPNFQLRPADWLQRNRYEDELDPSDVDELAECEPVGSETSHSGSVASPRGQSDWAVDHGISGSHLGIDLWLLGVVWLRIWVVASATLLFRLCKALEQAIGEGEADIKERDEEVETSSENTPSTTALLYRMSDSSNSAANSHSSPEAGSRGQSSSPLTSPADSTRAHPIATPYPSNPALGQRAAQVPPPPLLSDPGPVHSPPISTSIPPYNAIQEACGSARDAFIATGNVPTRPMIACSPQAYFIQDRVLPDTGRSQIFIALNAGIIVYNPEAGRSSHQMGHLYMEFFPRQEGVPLAPRAAQRQNFNYMFEPTILADGHRNEHGLNPDDVHCVPQGCPAMVPRGPPLAQVPQPVTGQEREEGEVEDEQEKVPVLVDIPSDMEVDSGTDTDSDDASGAPPQTLTITVAAAPSRPGRVIPLKSIKKPSLPCGFTLRPLAPDSPSSSQSSLALVPLRRPTFERSSEMPRGLIPLGGHPDRLLSAPIVELSKRLPRENVGDPVYCVDETPSDVPDWRFTSLFKIVQGTLAAESKATYLNRLTTALKAVTSEIYYQHIEERSEDIWSPTDDPDLVSRLQYHQRLQTPGACQLLVSKFRYRVGVARGQSVEPTVLSAANFDSKAFTQGWILRKALATHAGRWKYRKLPCVFIYQELFRYMVMFTEYLMLRRLDHVFRARYHAYRSSPRFVAGKYGPLLGNKLLTYDARIWLLVAWELSVHMGEVEMSSLIQTILRIRFLDASSLEYLQRGRFLPEIPTELPGTYAVQWQHIMAPMEDYDRFVRHVFDCSLHPVTVTVPANYALPPAHDNSPKVEPHVTILELQYPYSPSSSSDSISSSDNAIEIDL
ncbi:hypothetical protein V5O48_015459 [Marasmius crinis-equi]|uniref:Peptidase A2 domain-containing protein n=1 Tax=Marasmius crinis-equi TaxID=585013 RepID=A0ABR3EUG9_9AGAR